MTAASVLARETVDEDLRAFEPQGTDDVLAGAGVGGGGDGDARHAGEELGQPAQGPVIRTEIMSPL
jgi:hypothetical protein